jgi:hypothetical protein
MSNPPTQAPNGRRFIAPALGLGQTTARTFELQLAKLPVELKREVLELVVGESKKLASELAYKSSVCRKWYVLYHV